jgi:hypothetical protein
VVAVGEGCFVYAEVGGVERRYTASLGTAPVPGFPGLEIPNTSIVGEGFLELDRDAQWVIMKAALDVLRKPPGGGSPA